MDEEDEKEDRVQDVKSAEKDFQIWVKNKDNPELFDRVLRTPYQKPESFYASNLDVKSVKIVIQACNQDCKLKRSAERSTGVAADIRSGSGT
jgi:hypothetical protein